jgi:hypothetical protein
MSREKLAKLKAACEKAKVDPKCAAAIKLRLSAVETIIELIDMVDHMNSCSCIKDTEQADKAKSKKKK